MYADIVTDAMTIRFPGARNVGEWMNGLDHFTRNSLGDIALHHSRKMASALNDNGGGTKGKGKYWVNRTGRLANSIRPEGAFVQDFGNAIVGHVTCESGVYSEYGRTILHRARRRPRQIFFRDPVGKSPAQMVMEEFKPSFIAESSMVLQGAISKSMKGLTL